MNGIGHPTVDRRDVPLTQLSTLDDIIEQPVYEPCPVCGEQVPQDKLNEHVYNGCETKSALDEVKVIKDEREARRELREILSQKGY